MPFLVPEVAQMSSGKRKVTRIPSRHQRSYTATNGVEVFGRHAHRMLLITMFSDRYGLRCSAKTLTAGPRAMP